MHDRQLVVVANRLPVARVDGEWRSSPGGLGARPARLPPPDRPRCGSGWAGAADDPEDRFEVDGIEVATVPLSAEQISGFYDGVSNDAIWPLYHDALRPSTYDADDWRQYVEVNERFAERTAAVAEPGAVVWVHDYQLQLVPALLRRLRPDLRIGFFLHIPFPPAGAVHALPVARGGARRPARRRPRRLPATGGRRQLRRAGPSPGRRRASTATT